MAYNVEKDYICTTRKQFLQKVYDVISAGDANWEIIHEEGGYDSGAPSDQDYFVLQCKTAWADDGVTKQQILMCARDAASGSGTFGGAGGVDWTITDDSFSFIYSPDGGWNVTTKNFSDRAGSLTEHQIDYCPSTSSTPGIVASIVTAPDAIMLFGLFGTAYCAMYAGAITSLDSAADDPRPCHMFWGLGQLNDTSLFWGYDSANTSCQGFVPNAARTAWSYAHTNLLGEHISTRQRTKNGNKWAELPMLVYDSSNTSVAGVLTHVRRTSQNLTAGSSSSDGTRISSYGISFPWGN
jgi:hypothetical protein